MAEVFGAEKRIAGTEAASRNIEIADPEYATRTIISTPCGNCSPPIPDTIYITFTGLGGTFAAHNGTHDLTWSNSCIFAAGECVRPDCTWCSVTGLAPPLIFLYYNSCWDRWHCGMFLPPLDCSIQFKSVYAPPCDPSIGNYTQLPCIDNGCADPNSCEDSTGALVSISLL